MMNNRESKLLIYYLLQMATEEGQVSQKPAYQPPSRNTTLIEALREQPSFLMEQYNQKLKVENESKGIKRAGGVYIPPHKLRQLQQEMMEADPESEAHQRMMWQLLRKSINGIVNKVNIANIQNVVVQLFNENIYRGRGLLARSIIKAQMASPNFTHVYTALISVINTKVPEIGLLIAKRVIIQFKRSFERNNKIVCVATTKMIAHLVNQRVLGEYIALQILLILLTTPTEDSVEIACDFMIEVGQVLSEITPAGSTAIFQQFKNLLHEAEIEQKAQYSIENLFAVRKTGFKEHPGVIPELDLVEAEDQITHQIDIEEELSGQEALNIFKKDPHYLETEDQWQKIKMEILGEENIARLKEAEHYEEEWDEEPQQQGIQDLTEQDLINLRKTIYLAIQSTVNFEECAHKIIKMNIAKGYEHELVDMILECCMMERIYQSFFGLLAERFCYIDEKFKELFIEAFLNQYNNIFKQEANKIRNLAHLFGHLFYRKAVDWKVLQAIRLTPDSTTAAARMFLKIFLKDIAQNMGIDNLAQQFKKEDLRQYFEGLFPIDNPSDLRFAINYYTTIGLGKLTEEMREVLALQEEILNERRKKEEEAMAQLLLQEEQQLMREAMEEQRVKQQAKKLKDEQRQNRQRARKKEYSAERQKGRDKRQRSRQKYRQRGDREKERDRSKERERDRSKQKERRIKQKEKRKKYSDQSEKEDEEKRRREELDEERNRQKIKQRQRQREREKEKEKERQKKEQEREQKKREREEKERQKQEKEAEARRINRERQKQEKKMREKQEYERQKRRKQHEKRQRQLKRRRQKSQSEERRRQRYERKRGNKRRARSSSSSNTPANKQPTKQKISSKAQPEKIKKQRDAQSSSSGISSSSDSESSSSSSSPVAKKQVPKKAISVSSDSSDSSSSSSGQVESTPKRKRVASESSS